MDLGLFHQLRILSAAEVARKRPSAAYSIRQIFRWYSKTFHTPLHQVADIPLYDVIQAYYESSFESMEEEDFKKEIHELAMSKEEKEAFHFAEDAEEYSLKLLEQELAAAQEKAPQKTVESIAVNKPIEPKIEVPEIKMSFLDLDEGQNLLEQDPLDFAYEQSTKNTS